jgi:hypothetical protein
MFHVKRPLSQFSDYGRQRNRITVARSASRHVHAPFAFESARRSDGLIAEVVTYRNPWTAAPLARRIKRARQARSGTASIRYPHRARFVRFT